MPIEYKVRISEKQRKLIMRALTTTVANNRRSTSGGVLGDDEWTELIGVFAALNPQAGDDLPEHCRHRPARPAHTSQRAHAISKRNKKQRRECRTPNLQPHQRTL